MKNYAHNDFSNLAPLLYNQQILDYGKTYGNGKRLAVKDISITKTGALCGSRIIMDILWGRDKDGNLYIADIASHADACALGIASAAICTEAAKGCYTGEIQNIAINLKNMLQNKSFSFNPKHAWTSLQCLQAAHSYPARHAAILLPLDAIIEAFSQQTNPL